MLTQNQECADRRKVSVILTVKNDASGSTQTLESLAAQSRMPDEIVVVDGGSTDETRSTVLGFASRFPVLRLVDAPGANIASGREIATRNATHEIIASIDAGCRAEPDWLERLIEPFEHASEVDVVAGMYAIEAKSLFEEVVGLATMRGQLTPVNPETFNPSGRSLAYSKAAWKRAGGWPTWLGYSEDTLFDHRLRRVARGWHFAGSAIVHWRPRTSFRKLARQFYCYGTGRGHTQIGAPDFAYNIRNLMMLLIALSTALISSWSLVIVGLLFFYFYILSFHGRALQIARHAGRWSAYPLAYLVVWVVLGSNLCGYLVGSWQRARDSDRFRGSMERYLTA